MSPKPKKKSPPKTKKAKSRPRPSRRKPDVSLPEKGEEGIKINW